MRNNTRALYLAARHPGVPWLAKVVAVLTVAYALSPIDLIPDFIPVIGYLDDLVILPIGIMLAVRLVPREVWQECQATAALDETALPANRRAAVVIIIIWLLALAGLMLWAWPLVAAMTERG